MTAAGNKVLRSRQPLPPIRYRVLLWLIPVVLSSACTPDLPEVESVGARLYVNRCGGCHRLYPPESMKAEMWRVQVDRMQGEMARRGVRPLDPEERDTLLQYLARHGA